MPSHRLPGPRHRPDRTTLRQVAVFAVVMAAAASAIVVGFLHPSADNSDCQRIAATSLYCR